MPGAGEDQEGKCEWKFGNEILLSITKKVLLGKPFIDI